MFGGGVGLSRRLRFPLIALAVIAWLGVQIASSAPAATDPSIGYDISFPQCNGTFPTNAAFSIIGVNAGTPYGANPCLGTGDGPSELSWAGMNTDLYANTADPGPAASFHWPTGQQSPRQCNTPSNPGLDTLECHYDYGWNAAENSYRDAVDAYISLGWAARDAARTPVANQWWLDVETANRWTSKPSLNVEALQGAVEYLSSVGALAVGFYSSASDWRTITAVTTRFASHSSWLAWATSPSDPHSRCGGTGFTGGRVALVQYMSGGFDADYRCAAQPAPLSFKTSAQTVIAGVPSGPITVGVSQPPSTGMTIRITSSSTAGNLSISTTGPWSASLSLPVVSGARTSPSFYYEDTRAGTPILTATASGYTTATQTEALRAAALAAIRLSQRNTQIRVGRSQSLSAAGADRFGNTVGVKPTWSVSPALGAFSPNPANPTTFTATAAGAGRIKATVGAISGTGSLFVLKKKRATSTARAARHRRSSPRTRPRLNVRPTAAAPGARVRVFGNAGDCPRGDTVFVLSKAFAGRSFAGLGAITTHVKTHGSFAATGRLRGNARPGRYTVSARCGGSNLGVTAHVRVR
jgi:hypothetical protein